VSYGVGREKTARMARGKGRKKRAWGVELENRKYEEGNKWSQLGRKLFKKLTIINYVHKMVRREK